jgi:hypothetical protein
MAQLPTRSCLIRSFPHERIECGICSAGYDSTHEPIKIPCGHIFGRQCMEKWLTIVENGKRRNNCPFCRQELCIAEEVDIVGDVNCQFEIDLTGNFYEREIHWLIQRVREKMIIEGISHTDASSEASNNFLHGLIDDVIHCIYECHGFADNRTIENPRDFFSEADRGSIDFQLCNLYNNIGGTLVNVRRPELFHHQNLRKAIMTAETYTWKAVSARDERVSYWMQQMDQQHFSHYRDVARRHKRTVREGTEPNLRDYVLSRPAHILFRRGYSKMVAERELLAVALPRSSRAITNALERQLSSVSFQDDRPPAYYQSNHALAENVTQATDYREPTNCLGRILYQEDPSLFYRNGNLYTNFPV